MSDKDHSIILLYYSGSSNSKKLLYTLSILTGSSQGGHYFVFFANEMFLAFPLEEKQLKEESHNYLVPVGRKRFIKQNMKVGKWFWEWSKRKFFVSRRSLLQAFARNSFPNSLYSLIS